MIYWRRKKIKKQVIPLKGRTQVVVDTQNPGTEILRKAGTLNIQDPGKTNEQQVSNLELLRKLGLWTEPEPQTAPRNSAGELLANRNKEDEGESLCSYTTHCHCKH